MSSRSNKRHLPTSWTAGVTSLEFALVFPMFMLLFLATIEFGRYWLTVHSLRTLAAEASRAALIDTTLGAMRRIERLQSANSGANLSACGCGKNIPRTAVQRVDFRFGRSIESGIFTLGAAALDACSSRSSNEISA